MNAVFIHYFAKKKAEPKFIVILWKLKPAMVWGFKPAQAWGCPCSIKCLFKNIRSALTPSLPLPFEVGVDS